MFFRHFIVPSYDDWHVMAAGSPIPEDPNLTKIVAFAVRDISYKNKRKLGSKFEPQSRR